MDVLPRPSLPSILLLLAFLWVGLVLGESLVWQHKDHGGIGLWIIMGLLLIAMLCSLCALWGAKRSFTPLMLTMLLACGMSLGLGVAGGNWTYQCTQQDRLLASGGSNYVVLVTSDVSRGSYGDSSQGAIIQIDGKSCRKAVVTIQWPDESTPGYMGQRCWVKGSLRPLGTSDYARSKWRQGTIATLKVTEIVEKREENSVKGVICSLRQKCVEAMETGVTAESLQEGMYLLQGVVLGYRTNLNQAQVSESFRLCGLSHLIAVSGSHLAVVASLLAWVLQRLGCRKKFCVVATALLLLVYVILTGLQASAIRSCVMAIIGSFAWLFGRRRHSLSALVIAALMLLISSPTMCFSLGFQLSVAAVFSLTLFSSLIQHWLTALVPLPSKQNSWGVLFYKGWLSLASLFALTFSAMLGTLPLALPRFSILSLVGPIANIVISPLISLQIIVGILGVVVQPLMPVLAQVAYFFGSFIGAFAAVLVKGMAGLPLSFVSLSVEVGPLVCISLGIAAALWLTWPQPTRRRGACALSALLSLFLVLLLGYVAPLRPQIVMLNVGQGDAFLLRDGTQCYLVDTGNEEELLQQALTRNRVSHIDALFITHLDQDHCGALEALGAMAKVDEVYLASGTCSLCKQGGLEKFSATYEELCNLVGSQNIKEIKAGSKSTLGKHLELKVIWPRSKVANSSNEESLSFVVSYQAKGKRGQSYTAFFFGDAEAEVIHEILSDYPTMDNRDLVMLKVPHHGSKNGLTSQIMKSLHPLVALISVGEDNSYGHPAEDTLQLLEDFGVSTFRSDCQGDVKLLLKRRCLRATCQYSLEES